MTASVAEYRPSAAAQAAGDNAAADLMEHQADVLEARAAQLRDQAAELSSQAVAMRAEVARIRRPDVFGHVEISDKVRKRYGSDDAYMMRRVADALDHFGEPITSTALADYLNAGQARVRTCLQRLEAVQAVRRTGIARGTRWSLISEDDAPVEATADLNGARTLEGVIRDACRDLDVFTFEELAAKLPDVSEQTLRRWLPKLEKRGSVYGEVITGRRKLYEFVKAEGTCGARERRETPEAEAVRQFGQTSGRRGDAVAGTGAQAFTDQGTRELVEAVRSQGADVVPDGKSHWKVVRDGKAVIASDGRPLTFASTPGDHRSKKNDRARVRRSGFKVA
jgi:DNA-binding HxlR family transcriptional regulator